MNTINIYAGNTWCDITDATTGERLYRFVEESQEIIRSDGSVLRPMEHADAVSMASVFKMMFERAGAFVAMFSVIGMGMDDYGPTAVVELANL